MAEFAKLLINTSFNNYFNCKNAAFFQKMKKFTGFCNQLYIVPFMRLGSTLPLKILLQSLGFQQWLP